MEEQPSPSAPPLETPTSTNMPASATAAASAGSAGTLRSQAGSSAAPREPRTEEDFRKLRRGCIFIVFMDSLISLPSIVLSEFFPGLCLAASISILFSCVLLLWIAHGNVGFLKDGSWMAGVSFIVSLTASLCAAGLAFYSILIDLSLLPGVARPWATLVCGLWWLGHFGLEIRILRILLRKLTPGEEKKPATPESTSPAPTSQNSLSEVS